MSTARQPGGRPYPMSRCRRTPHAVTEPARGPQAPERRGPRDRPARVWRVKPFPNARWRGSVVGARRVGSSCRRHRTRQISWRPAARRRIHLVERDSRPGVYGEVRLRGEHAEHRSRGESTVQRRHLENLSMFRYMFTIEKGVAVDAPCLIYGLIARPTVRWPSTDQSIRESSSVTRSPILPVAAVRNRLDDPAKREIVVGDRRARRRK